MWGFYIKTERGFVENVENVEKVLTAIGLHNEGENLAVGDESATGRQCCRTGVKTQRCIRILKIKLIKSIYFINRIEWKK